MPSTFAKYLPPVAHHPVRALKRIEYKGNALALQTTQRTKSRMLKLEKEKGNYLKKDTMAGAVRKQTFPVICMKESQMV